jgi:flagellar biosynthetic protein FlhB
MAESSAGERTLEPTPRRIEQARREGQIASSPALIAAVALASVCLVLVVGGRAGIARLVAYIRAALSDAVSAEGFTRAIQLGLDVLISMLWLPVGCVCLAIIVVSLVQTRGNVATVRLRADRWRRRRPLGRDGVVAIAVDGCTLIVLCMATYLALRSYLPALPTLAGAPPARVLHVLGELARRLGIGLAVGMLVFGLADYAWRVARHRRRMRMTWEEAKREYRESEGAPELKLERERLHLAWSADNLAASLGGRDWVVTDPGVLAVALSYAGSVDEVPVLLGKGEGRLAREIEVAARAAAVPLIEEPGLAATLALLDAGDEIPESLYSAVTEAMVRGKRA